MKSSLVVPIAEILTSIILGVIIVGGNSSSLLLALFWFTLMMSITTVALQVYLKNRGSENGGRISK